MMTTSIKNIQYENAKERWKRMGMVKTSPPTAVVKREIVLPEPEPEAIPVIVKKKRRREKPIVWKNKHGTFMYSPYKPITRQVVELVCEYFNVEEVDLLADRRSAELIYPRHMAYYLCKRCSTQSLTQIGRSFLRDHTTILSGIRKIERLIVDNRETQDDYYLLQSRLNGTGSIDPNEYWGA